jgi:DNA polymerase
MCHAQADLSVRRAPAGDAGHRRQSGARLSPMDALAALRLQIAWGADEALEDDAVDRTRPVPVQTATAGRSALPPAGIMSASPPSTPAPAPLRAGTAARAQALADAAPTIEALRAALAGFTACPLAVTATNLVFADGNPAAGLVLVSDTPGPEEDLSGVPLSGPAGALMDRMLASIDLDRTKLLVTSLIPWRPPGGRAATESEIAMCLPFFMRHLALLQPRIVVSLGALPAKVLTNNDFGIRRLRGRVHVLQLKGVSAEVKLLPMLHPAHLLRAPGAKKEAWADLLALQRMLNSA